MRDWYPSMQASTMFWAWQSLEEPVGVVAAAEVVWAAAMPAEATMARAAKRIVRMLLLLLVVCCWYKSDR